MIRLFWLSMLQLRLRSVGWRIYLLMLVRATSIIFTWGRADLWRACHHLVSRTPTKNSMVAIEGQATDMTAACLDWRTSSQDNTKRDLLSVQLRIDEAHVPREPQ
jgi:hypothetical protein